MIVLLKEANEKSKLWKKILILNQFKKNVNNSEISQ